MYCVNCGVKLGEAEEKCPLCGTVVYHPDFKQNENEKLYPSDKMPDGDASLKSLNGAIVILLLLPLIVSLFSDIQSNGKVDWFGYVLGASVVGYVTLLLPLWFKKRNPVIFVPCSFAASALYLLYINIATNGNWFMSFAFPVIGGLCLITCAVIVLVYYLKRGRLYIFGGAFILLGGFALLIEYLLNITFQKNFIGWSIYPLAVLVLLGSLLIYLAVNREAREIIKRKMFF